MIDLSIGIIGYNDQNNLALLLKSLEITLELKNFFHLQEVKLL